MTSYDIFHYIQKLFLNYKGVSFLQWKLFVLVLGFAPDADFLRLAAALSRPFFTFATSLNAGFVTIPFLLGLELLLKKKFNLTHEI